MPLEIRKYLKKRSRWSSDWPIARLVGSATYSELMDAAPGLFEPFEDWRGMGNSSSSLAPFFEFINFVWGGQGGSNIDNVKIPKEFNVPTPPNLVSTILADGDLSGEELKALLILACTSGKIDPRIEPLIGSSAAYTNPILSMGEIFFTFAIFSFLVATLMCFLLLIYRSRNFTAYSNLFTT